MGRRASVDPWIGVRILPRHMFTIIGADGKEYGPVTAANITDWIAAGRANLQTKARREGETEWRTLGEFAEFNIPPALPVTAPPAAPTFAAPAPLAPVSASSIHQLASRWVRLGAVLLDSVIGAVCLAPGFVILLSAGIFSAPNNPNPALLIGGFLAMGVGLLILLAIQIYLLTTRGQTVGKKLLNIKIVTFEDGSNPGFVKVFLLRILVNGLIGAVPLLGAAYSLADILFIFRDDQRCIHDLLAGTTVVVA